MLGDPSVVASWRFLSAESATSGTTPRSTPAARAPDFQPAAARQPRSGGGGAHDGVEHFLKQAESELWHGADVDEDALIDRVEALLAGPEPAAEPLHLPRIPSARAGGGGGRVAYDEAEGEEEDDEEDFAAERGGGVDFDNYMYANDAGDRGGARESLGGGAAHGVAAAAGVAGGPGIGEVGSASDLDEAGAERPASTRPFDEQAMGATGATAATGIETGAAAAATGGPGGGIGGLGGPGTGMGRVSRVPRGARTGQVVPLPTVVVDSSFTYTPRQPRARPARYGAWYLPIKSWKKGGAPKPPPQLTKDEKEKIEETTLKRVEMDAAIKTKAAPPAFKEFLRHQRASEALEVLEQATTAFSDPGQLEEFAAIADEFNKYKLSSRELQKRIKELLAGGPIQRQQLGLQFINMCKDDSDFPAFLTGV